MDMNADYEGFVRHVEEWKARNIPYGIKDLIALARRYHTPIPKITNYVVHL